MKTLWISRDSSNNGDTSSVVARSKKPRFEDAEDEDFTADFCAEGFEAATGLKVKPGDCFQVQLVRVPPKRGKKR